MQTIERSETLGPGGSWVIATNFNRLFRGEATFYDADPSDAEAMYYRAAVGKLPGMIWISPGIFRMGSAPEEAGHLADEDPVTNVKISQGFWIGEKEVTQREYQTVMGNNPSGFSGDERLPVEMVSWQDATNYCKKLTQQERQAGRIDEGYEYRLPTEAEWEYACRLGTTTRFSFGEDPQGQSLGDYAWYSKNSATQTHLVGLKTPYASGLFDMSGNVWEWCLDWYGPYGGGQVVDPTGPGSGSERVKRGGAWKSPLLDCRSASRGHAPGEGQFVTGFRPVLVYLNKIAGGSPGSDDMTIDLVPQITVKGEPGVYSIEYLEIINDMPRWKSIDIINIGSTKITAYYDTNVWRGVHRNYRVTTESPNISLSGDLLFGDLSVGSISNRVLTISNIGTATLTIHAISYPEGFSGDWNGGTIAGHGKQAVTITFAPTALRAYSGGITVDSNAVLGTNAIAISGNGTGMVWIPRGAFTMGSPESEPDWDFDEVPQTVVTISAGFWMGRYEVTQQEYLAVMGSNPSFFTGDLKRPVENVSWIDATSYCAKLTQQEHAVGRLRVGYEYRLPTEAQWEYACRAGTTTATAFGNSLSSTKANFNGNYPYNGAAKGPYLGQTSKEGRYSSPNAWGLYDMHGNVWEWCQDWYSSYPGRSVIDPKGPSSGSYRVFRGGSWRDSGHYCRSAYRYEDLPSVRYFNLGFRVALVQVP